jgi:thiamine biosynthesis lipoprotein
MNRRDFVDPRHLAQRTGQLLGAVESLLESDVPAPAVEETALLRASRRAMATDFEVLLPYGTPGGLSLAEAAFDEIDRLEQQLTVYRESSEVSRLNRLAWQAPVPVEEGLFELLRLAERLTRQTDGAFDITAGALIKVWGFFHGPRRVPGDEERRAALERVGMRHVSLDPDGRTVRFHKRGLEINLGAIGKGYALDRAAQLLRQRGNLPAALLHGGHSSVYAMGTEPGDGRGWSVGLRHPWQPGRRLAVLRLRDRALGTSAATFQHLEYNGKKLGHLLDPRSGWPAEGMASASVVADSAAEADALATAFFILGVDRARAYCESHPGIGAVLLAERDEAEPLVVGLPPTVVSLCGLTT